MRRTARSSRRRCAGNAGVRAGGEESPAPPPLALEPVVVTATRLPQPLSDVPASVSVVEQFDIQGAQKTVGLEEALDRVPGVLVQSSQDFAQDVRIQIRGFGTRSPSASARSGC